MACGVAWPLARAASARLISASSASGTSQSGSRLGAGLRPSRTIVGRNASASATADLGGDPPRAAGDHDHVAGPQRRRAWAVEPGRHRRDRRPAVARQADLRRPAPEHLFQDRRGGLVGRPERGVEVDRLARDLGPLVPGRLGQPGQPAARRVNRRGQAPQPERPVEPRDGHERRAAVLRRPAQARRGRAHEPEGVLERRVRVARRRGQHDQPVEPRRRAQSRQLGGRDHPWPMAHPLQPARQRRGQVGAVVEDPELSPRPDHDRLAPTLVERHARDDQPLDRQGTGRPRRGDRWDLLTLDLGHLRRFERSWTRPRGQELDDLAEGPERAQVLGLDHRRLGQSLLQGREDLDPLDRVDPQVGVELHARLEHLRRVSRLLRHHLQEHLLDPSGGQGQGRGAHRGLGRVRRRDRRSGRPLAQELGDLPQGPERAQVLGLDHRRLGQPFLQGREDLDPLDRVDPQVGVELHVRLEHLRRVSRLLRHHLQ